MALVLISLNAVTVTGPGSVLSFDKPRGKVSMQVIPTGNPTVSVNLEVSLDGINFDNISGVSGPGFTALSFPVLYARANLTVLSGGTSPTVTAIIAASD